MNGPAVLVNHEAAARLRSGHRHGELTLRYCPVTETAAVIAVGVASTSFPTPMDERGHFLSSAPTRGGLWTRATALLHQLGYAAGARGVVLTRDGFAAEIEAQLPSAGGSYIVITHAPDAIAPVPDLCAWAVSPYDVAPLDIDVQPPPDLGGIAALTPYWPVKVLGAARIAIVGLGSIGSTTAHCLARYGIGHLDLIDPDRLRWHNLIRHTSAARHVGAYKVHALHDELHALRPDTTVRPFTWDIVTDADLLRGLLDTVDMIICCADGVTPRRVVSHLARSASRTAILSCVLDDGSIGEIIRLRPWPDQGCLDCRRRTLEAEHGIEPEPTLDAGYGIGTLHRPMTAVGGDLDIVATLTAGIAISTMRLRAGHPGQRLPGEQLTIGLQPNAELSPPFDFSRSLDIRWSLATPPAADCPTCTGPPNLR